MTRYRLEYRCMDNRGRMESRTFLGFVGDISDRRKLTVSTALDGYSGPVPTYSEEEVIEQVKLLDFMCNRTNLSQDRVGSAFARQLVKVAV